MKYKAFLLVAAVGLLTACGGGESQPTTTPEAPSMLEETTPAVAEEVDPMDNVGIGPIDELTFDEDVDPAWAEEGKVIFEAKCTACHKTNKRYIGPSPAGIFERRNPAWVMNMILNPDEMVQKDPQAKALLAEYASPMANQNLTEDEARAVVEYFRTLTEE